MTLSQIKERLQAELSPNELEVIDLTGTEDHYQVAISSDKFRGLSRIEQQRLVMDVFAPELKTGELHAFSIKTKIPAAI